MAPFDIIETSGQAYIKAWEERRYLLRLAFFPFVTKLVFFAVVILLGLQDNILRQTLVMLPVYFLEGWMMVHIVRLIFFDERWPLGINNSNGDQTLFYKRRAQAVFAGILVYVLIKMLLNAMAAPFMSNELLIEPATTAKPEPNLILFIITTFAFLFLIWLFRYLFLFIPMAAHLKIKKYVSLFPGMLGSLKFLGAWLTCYIPFVLAGIFCLSLIGPFFAGNEGFTLFLIFVMNFVVDLCAMSVTTICFSLAVKSAISPNKQV